MRRLSQSSVVATPNFPSIIQHYKYTICFLSFFNTKLCLITPTIFFKTKFVSRMHYRIFFSLLILFGAMSAVLCQLPDHVGVCNGRVGGNLPTEEETVELYKLNGIKRMRIYDPNQRTLRALRDSGIELILDVPNVELESLRSDATQWVQTNVVPYFPATKIRYIAVGNEVDPDKAETSGFVGLVLPAMESIHRALSDAGLQGQIKVSTAIYSAILDNTYPPSDSVFKHSFMTPIVKFLNEKGSPLLANIYPYFAYIDRSSGIQLDYALFTSSSEDNGYKNLFDAMVDGVYYALEKLPGGAAVEVVVSESGWPSGGGGDAETVSNAETYYRNLISHVGGGTPKRPGKALETYLFAMFDENQKPGSTTERHFGLFSPINRTPKYPRLGLKSA